MFSRPSFLQPAPSFAFSSLGRDGPVPQNPSPSRQPGAELASREHQFSQGHLGGPMWRHSITEYKSGCWKTCPVVELLNCLLNSSASVLASGFLAVLRTCLKPRYLLKFRKVCSSSRGPLSLPKTMGNPRSENTRFSFGITARALVQLTNSTSAHRELLTFAVPITCQY